MKDKELRQKVEEMENRLNRLTKHIYYPLDDIELHVNSVPKQIILLRNIISSLFRYFKLDYDLISKDSIIVKRRKK